MSNSPIEDLGEEPRGIGNSPLLVSLMPFVLLVLLYIVFPEYGRPAFQGVGLVAVFFALLWGALGIYLVSESDGFGKAIGAITFFSLPASFAVVMAPWFKL